MRKVGNRITIGTRRNWGRFPWSFRDPPLTGFWAALRTTILQKGVPGESIFLGRAILLEGLQEEPVVWLPEPSGESDGLNILPNQAPSRLGPIVIRLPTSHTYPTKNRKFRKNAIHEGGMSRPFSPLKWHLPFAKGQKRPLQEGRCPI